MDIVFQYPPELMSLLIDTIPLLCRSKKDVLLFLKGAGVGDAFTQDLRSQLAQNPESLNKYEITRTVLSRLNERGEASLRERREVLKRVVEFEEFSTCWPTDQLKAKGLVAEIRKVIVGQSRLIERMLAHHNALRRGLSMDEIAPRAVYDHLTAVAPKVLPYMDSVWSLLDHKRREGKRILFEGAQGALLDIDHGTYPYVTSSNTVASQAATGSGMGPSSIGYVLGICKAYTTRVGSGPFPSELPQGDPIGDGIGERGREFGTVTGRRRRCGWFDAVLVRQTVRTSGIDGLALTKLDILDGIDEIKVCVGYRLDGREIDYLPAGEHAQAQVEPIYETIEGWQAPTARARSWADLPAAAIKYVRRVEELVGCPVALLSTSPEREDTILVTNPFEN